VTWCGLCKIEMEESFEEHKRAESHRENFRRLIQEITPAFKCIVAMF